MGYGMLRNRFVAESLDSTGLRVKAAVKPEVRPKNGYMLSSSNENNCGASGNAPRARGYIGIYVVGIDDPR